MVSLIIAHGITLFIGIVLLWFSGDQVVTCLIKAAHAFNITTLFAGFIISAIATNIPELMVIISSTWYGTPGLAAGNLLGSNFIDIAITLGYTLTMAGALIIEPPDYRKFAGAFALTFFIVAVLSALESIHRVAGVFLILLYGACFCYLVTARTAMSEGELKKPERPHHGGESKLFVVGRLGVTMALLLIASQLIVYAGISLASLVAIPAEIVGSTLIALGTALPEIALSIIAVRRNEHSLTLGNALGSVLEKSTLLLGLLAVLSPAPLKLARLRDTVIFLMISCVIIGYGILKRRKLNHYEGIALLSLYAFFIGYRFWSFG